MLSKLSKVTQQVSGKTMIRTQIYMTLYLKLLTAMPRFLKLYKWSFSKSNITDPQCLFKLFFPLLWYLNEHSIKYKFLIFITYTNNAKLQDKF